MTDLEHEIRGVLEAAGIPTAAGDAARIIQVSSESGGDVASRARAFASERATGRPLPLVLGRERFMGLDLETAPGVLAPREETELLARAAIARAEAVQAPDVRIVDMCTGSGNLACAIAHHLPRARVFASDLTTECVTLARRNAARLGLQGRVTVGQGDLFAGLAPFGLEGTVDVVVCNPPYISQGRLEKDGAHLLEHEPREAFDGGPYGLSIHQRVAKEALPFLKGGGPLLFEIGLGQDRQAKILIDRTKAYGEVTFLKDSAGNPRVVIAVRNSSK